MTENLPEYNPGELWWRLIFSPGVAGEFGLKNKMPNKIKLETQDKAFINPPKSNFSATTISIHYPVIGRHMNFICILECVSPR